MKTLKKYQVYVLDGTVPRAFQFPSKKNALSFISELSTKFPGLEFLFRTVEYPIKKRSSKPRQSG